MGRFFSDRCEKAIQLIWYQYDRTQFPEGIRLLNQAIEEGKTEAYYFLGRCYNWEDGGLKEDRDQALQLYQRGAEYGSARCVLGADRTMGLTSEFLAASRYSLEESFAQVLAAAKEGEAMAQYQIGCAYYWGDVAAMDAKNGREKTEREYEEIALRWFVRAAEQGVHASMVNAGSCYLNGNGTPEDPQRSEVWYIKAAALGEPRALNQVGNFCYDREDYKRAVMYYQKAAEAECEHAYGSLADCYLNGLGTEKDDARALYWYDKGAQTGNLVCINNVAYCHENGYGCQQDYAQAMKLYSITAQRKSAYGNYRIGRMYENGFGVEQDYEKAMEFYRKAADLGSVPAKDALGGFKKTLFGKWKKR